MNILLSVQFLLRLGWTERSFPEALEVRVCDARCAARTDSTAKLLLQREASGFVEPYCVDFGGGVTGISANLF
jgi:hypothetical protein